MTSPLTGLGSAWRLYRYHAKDLLALVVLAALPVIGVAGLIFLALTGSFSPFPMLRAGGGEVVQQVARVGVLLFLGGASIVVEAVVSGAVAAAFIQIDRIQRVSVGGALRRGWRRAPELLRVNALRLVGPTLLIVAGGVMPTGGETGEWLVRWALLGGGVLWLIGSAAHGALAIPLVIYERRGAVDAYRRSLRLVRQRGGGAGVSLLLAWSGVALLVSATPLLPDGAGVVAAATILLLGLPLLGLLSAWWMIALRRQGVEGRGAREVKVEERAVAGVA